MLIQNGIRPEEDVTIRGLEDDYPRQLELFERDEIFGLLFPEPNGTIGEARGVVKCPVIGRRSRATVVYSG
jgi:hypothetical protein